LHYWEHYTDIHVLQENRLGLVLTVKSPSCAAINTPFALIFYSGILDGGCN
jgi:hypothetical protein